MIWIFFACWHTFCQSKSLEMFEIGLCPYVDYTNRTASKKKRERTASEIFWFWRFELFKIFEPITSHYTCRFFPLNNTLDFVHNLMINWRKWFVSIAISELKLKLHFQSKFYSKLIYTIYSKHGIPKLDWTKVYIINACLLQICKFIHSCRNLGICSTLYSLVCIFKYAVEMQIHPYLFSFKSSILLKEIISKHFQQILSYKVNRNRLWTFF